MARISLSISQRNFDMRAALQVAGLKVRDDMISIRNPEVCTLLQASGDKSDGSNSFITMIFTSVSKDSPHFKDQNVASRLNVQVGDLGLAVYVQSMNQICTC